MSKVYSRSKLVSYIVDSLESGVDATKLSQSVASYLLDAGKAADLDSVMRDVQEQRALKSGIVEVDVRTAHELDKEQISLIEKVSKQQYPKASKVVLNKIHDESVVGGANLSFANANFDVTVRGKLNRLREGIQHS